MRHRQSITAVVLFLLVLEGMCSGHRSVGSQASNTHVQELCDVASAVQVEVTDDGAWSWLPEPRAVCHAGSKRQTYIGWVDGEGEVWVASYDHASGVTEQTRLTDGLGGDDHSNPSLLVLDDGRIAAFYSAHGGDAIFSRTSLSPEDITAWSDASSVTAINRFAGGNWGYTYPNAIKLASVGGQLFVFFRGPDFKQWFVTSTDGLQWSSERQLMAGSGTKPYFKYASDGIASIHIAFTDGHPRGEPKNSIYYMRYRDGAFYKADGTLAAELGTLPFSPADADTVYDGKAETGRAWISDIAVDSKGQPVVVYATFPSVDDHRCFYATWDGADWVSSEITATGASFSSDPIMRAGRLGRPLHYLFGGASADPTDVSVVYLSREINSVYEIERWCTPDSGRTWTGHPVTAGSAVHNVRPCVPRCALGDGPIVLWLSGTYKDYDAYEMSVQMMVRDEGALPQKGTRGDATSAPSN